MNSKLNRNELVGAKILGCSFYSKVTTTLSDQVVGLHCEGSSTNQNSLSSSLSRHCLIHEFGDLDMPLAVAQLGNVQEHPKELQRTSSSLVELQRNLNRAPVPMELKFSSGTPGNPLLRPAGSAPCQNKHVLGENIYLPGANYIFVLYFIK